MKMIEILTTFIVLSGCTSVPKKVLGSSEITARLMALSRASDYEGVAKFFDEYGYCVRPDELVGCVGQEVGFEASGNRDLLTANVFIRNHQKMVETFNDRFNYCENKIDCLSGIEIRNPMSHYESYRACSDSDYKGKGTCKKHSYKHSDGKVLVTFSNSAEALNDSWLPSDLVEKFNSAFVPQAEALNGKNQPLIEEDKSARLLAKTQADEKEKVIMEKIKAQKCRNLPGYQIVQKLEGNTYEIAIPDVKKTFSASQAMGGYSNSFVQAGAHAILVTTKTEFTSEGYLPPNFYVNEAGVKKIELKNGFSEKFPVYRENSVCTGLFEQLYRR